MAEQKGRESGQRSGEQQLERRREGGMARRGEHFPSAFAMSPRDFFAMSPFALMRRFTDEMDRMFAGAGRESSETAIWAPCVEVREEQGNLIINAELPGLKREDVKIEATDQGLVIQGERKREHEEKQEGFVRSERSYGRFYRLIPLPDEAKLDQAKAQFNDGVLEIRIPVPETQHRRREIPIETETRTRTSGGGG